MLEIAWCRYIQSEYIKRMSKKALEQAEKVITRYTIFIILRTKEFIFQYPYYPSDMPSKKILLLL